MSTKPLQPTYEPYDESTQTAWRIKGYDRSFTRTPDAAKIARPLTLTELTGPQGLDRRFEVDTADLSRLSPTAPRAFGQLMLMQGQILDQDNAPVAGAVVEMWQANASGKYIHEYDQADAPVDPNFIGSGRFVTDAEGRFSFTTIKPGAYPVPDSGKWWRPPHIHFSIFGDSWMSRLVTQMFFPGDPLNAHDRLLNSVADPAARERLIARAVPTTEGPENALVFRHTMVLRGHAETPALDEA